VRHHLVVASVEVDPYFARLGGIEPAMEVRLGRLGASGGGEAHVEVAVPQPFDARDFGLVRGVDVDLAREQAIEPQRLLRQLFAAALEGGGEAPAVEPIVLRRHPPRGLVDDRVRDAPREIGRGLFPHGPLQLREDLPVLLPAVPGEADDGGVLGAELDEPRLAVAAQVEHQALEAGEGEVPVFRDRLPEGLARDLRPAPLVAMPVPVADQHVHQARAQESACVDAVGGTLLEQRVHLLVVEDARGAGEAGSVRRGRARILLDRADETLEDVTELAERRIVGHDDEPVLRMEHAGGLQQAVGHHRRRGVARRDLVPDQALGDRALQVRWQHVARVLVHAAERVVASVRAAKRETLRLLAADAAHRRESSREAAQVEHLDRHRRGPKVAVVATEEHPMERAGAVLRPGDRRRRAGGFVRGGRCREHRERSGRGEAARADHDDLRNGPPSGMRGPRASHQWPVDVKHRRGRRLTATLPSHTVREPCREERAWRSTRSALPKAASSASRTTTRERPESSTPRRRAVSGWWRAAGACRSCRTCSTRRTGTRCC
jgi:hypothetical protein